MTSTWNRLTVTVALLLAIWMASCVAPAPTATPTTEPTEQATTQPTTVATTAALTPFTVSLDWVPNTNHTGLYVALDKGWYAEQGLDVTIQVPSDPSAALRQVAYGNVPVGISFQEEVTIARSNDIPVVSIGAIIQHNTSAFAARADSDITSPKDFEGKRYGSHGLPIEQPILGEIMRCGGGDIDTVEFVDVGFDAFPALLSRRIDLAWIFLGWDGVQAELRGEQLKTWPLYESCVPDYYTPVIIAGETTIQQQPDLLRKFMAATARGYEYAIANPDEAAQIVLQASPETDPELMLRSQRYLSPRYQDDAPRWGEQKLEVWQRFGQFMFDNQLIATPVEPESAFTNAFLP